MIQKEEAKKEVKKLIERYEKYTASGEIIKFTNKEQTTKDTFILPLFKSLGWDVYNEKNIELVSEERLLKGAVDYAFCISGQYKLFVEAKPIGRDIKKDAQQAVEYGINSGNTWVVLTNFESLIIFNCEWQEKNWWKNALFELSYKDYLNKFDDLLWLLSKESILNNKLDEYASSVGKKVPRTPIDRELLSKFLQWRLKLSKDISKNYNYSAEIVDELVQKLLIRLLFIKNCEDRDFETGYKLLPAVGIYELHKKGLSKSLRRIFDYYNDVYDSTIFEYCELDKTDIDEDTLAEIIKGLYFTPDELRYNFKIIPADVMGNLYEQYLGHILKKTPQTAKLKEGKAHRKEQGIYYTPTYIVDYIVRNTLGELLKNKKVDASKIRVLDPACGSGSFLVKAFDVLNEHYAKDKMYEQKTLTGYSTKERILRNNIFGVDLDKQAAEIAQLNLLLRIAEKGQKLPLLKQNVKIGNSLIDDPAVAGDKAFKWEEQFKEIMKEGGFDIVIGNPPYGAELKDNEREFIAERYATAKSYKNTALIFIEKSVKLLKNDGYLGLIVPKSLAYSQAWKPCRDFIKKDLVLLVDVSKAFEGVLLEQVIFILKKDINKKSYTIENIENGDKFIVDKSFIGKIDSFIVHDSKADFDIFKKLISSSLQMKDISRTSRGLPFQKFVTQDKTTNKVFRGINISRYHLEDSSDFLKTVDTTNQKVKYLLQPKIISQRIVAHVTRPKDHIIIMSALDKEGVLNVDTIENTILTDKRFKLETVLAIMNSKLISWYAYRYIFGKAIRTMDFDDYYVGKIPIRPVTSVIENLIIKKTDKIIELNKKLHSIGDKKTDERAKLEEEIKKTDAEIDELVYKIYGITEKEKEIIEESLKR